MKFKLFFTILTSIFTLSLYSQPMIADKVIAVVGKNPILYSEIEDQYLQYKAQGSEVDRCVIFEEMLAQKLLVTQAEIDSIEITDGEVELELEQRLTYFINQIGSEQKLVEYFGKSIVEIKEDMRDMVREQITTQRMQAEIVKGMSITPKEVREFFEKMPADSVPYVDSEIELSQIIMYPRSSEQAIFEVKEKLLEIRERVLNGENFATLAVLYSQDGAATKGGDIGWLSRAELDPVYAKAAFALKPNQVSRIVESSFGFHLIQLIDKTEDRVRTRHIIMQPKISVEAREELKGRLDSLATLIRLDSIPFDKAAMFYSQDEDTRLNGGLRINPATLNTRFKANEFSTTEYYIIRNMKVGEISEAFESVDKKNKKVYKIILLKSRTEPHKANLKQDFDMIKSMALNEKRAKIVDQWLEDKAKDVYIRMEEPYDGCTFRIKSWQR